MKLPEDKKERTKVLALIGIGAVAILVGLFYGVIRPTVAYKKATLEKIVKLRADIAKATVEIDQMSKDRKANVETLEKIRDLSDRYLLKSRLGNFQLSAAEIIEQLAHSAGLPPEVVLQVKEVGLGSMARASNSKTAPVLRTYTSHLALVCDYNTLIRFIRVIEDSNPLFCVMNISIQGRPPPNMTVHACAFDVQWPVWVDPDMPSKLEAKLASSGADETKGADEKK